MSLISRIRKRYDEGVSKKKPFKRRHSGARRQPNRRARKQSPKDDCFDQLKGKIQIIGDIVAPIVPADIWQYDLNNLDSEPRD